MLNGESADLLTASRVLLLEMDVDMRCDAIGSGALGTMSTFWRLPTRREAKGAIESNSSNVAAAAAQLKRRRACRWYIFAGDRDPILLVCRPNRLREGFYETLRLRLSGVKEVRERPQTRGEASRGEDAATFVLEMLGGESFTCWAIDHAERTDLVASLREQHAAARAEMERCDSAPVKEQGARQISTARARGGLRS